ncbi:hypothetical protein D9M70_608250 [compost metagenome]
MVRAGERATIAAMLQAHLVATVRAAVEQQVDLSIAIAGHDHRLRTDRLQNEIVRLEHLADVPHIDPGPIPNLLQLLLEDFFVGVNRAMHSIGLDQVTPITGGDCRRHREPRE